MCGLYQYVGFLLPLPFPSRPIFLFNCFFQFFPRRGKVKNLCGVAVPFHHCPGLVAGQGLYLNIRYARKPSQRDERMSQAVEGQVPAQLFIDISIGRRSIPLPCPGYAYTCKLCFKAVP
jgi:hypothetical protein